LVTGVRRNVTIIGPNGKQNKFELPLKGITKEYTVTKVGLVIMLRDSGDDKISEAELGMEL
jgi:hypothetical protein